MTFMAGLCVGAILVAVPLWRSIVAVGGELLAMHKEVLRLKKLIPAILLCVVCAASVSGQGHIIDSPEANPDTKLQYAMTCTAGQGMPDYSKNGQITTIEALCTFDETQPGGAYNFTGANTSETTTPQDPAMDMDGDFTYLIWLKIAQTANLKAMFWNQQNSPTYPGAFCFQLNTDKFQASWRANNSQVNVATSNAVITASASWFCVVMTKQGTTCRLYVNGAFAGQVTAAGTSMSVGDANPLRMGTQRLGSDLYLVGKIGKLLFWTKKLSDDEIKNQYEKLNAEIQ